MKNGGYIIAITSVILELIIFGGFFVFIRNSTNFTSSKRKIFGIVILSAAFLVAIVTAVLTKMVSE